MGLSVALRLRQVRASRPEADDSLSTRCQPLNTLQSLTMSNVMSQLCRPEHAEVAMCQTLTITLPAQELPDVPVTLVADKWISDTTSDGAAGLWEVKTAHRLPEAC